MGRALLPDAVVSVHLRCGRFGEPIAIDPSIALGRPIVLMTGVSTHAIAERLHAGESVGELAEDYGLTGTETEEAALYERAP
jgi:uncharacterized protein (DUF433 family)